MESVRQWPVKIEPSASASERPERFERPLPERPKIVTDPSPGSSNRPSESGLPLASTKSKRPKTERFLYLIGSGLEGAPIKIGIAAKVESRLRDVQTGSPHPLVVLHVVELTPETVRKAEAACHRALKADRLTGEWFTTPCADAIVTVSDVIERRVWEIKVPRVRKLKEPAPRKPRVKKEAEAKVERIGVRLPPSLKDAAQALAAEEDRTLSKWIERLIRDAVEKGSRPN